MLLFEEKRNRRNKGRAVAWVGQQKDNLTKEEMFSWTLKTPLILLTATIEVDEDSEVRIHEIPKAFTQTKMTKNYL